MLGVGPSRALNHSRLPEGSLQPEQGPCAGLRGHAGQVAVLPGRPAQLQGVVAGCFQGEWWPWELRGGSPCEAAVGNKPVVMGWEAWRGAGQALWACRVWDLRRGPGAHTSGAALEGPSKPEQ